MNVIKRALRLIFEISRIILNQGSRKYICFLVNLWALISVIFVSCFSGGILSSILVRDMKAINTFEDLISSDVRIICFNNTFIYYGIKYADNWNDDKLKWLRDSNRVEYVVYNSNTESYLMRNLILERKAALIWDHINIELKRKEYMHYNLAIADEMSYQRIYGFLINRRSAVKDELYKMYNYL